MAAHEKLLERITRSSAGWGQDDLRRLYEGFGFRAREGGNHTFYQHPDYPQLLATVARHNELPPVYSAKAVELITVLQNLQEQKRVEDAKKEAEEGENPTVEAKMVFPAKQLNVRKSARRGKHKRK